MIDGIDIINIIGFRPASEYKKNQDFYNKFYGDKCIHEIYFKPVLREIEKKNWTEIDYHREKMRSCLNKIRHLDWIIVDEDKYNNVYFPKKQDKYPQGLTMSRYGHRSLGDKCYPNSKECVECFKYHCGCCGEGTNCMYGGYCSSRRCSNSINQMSFLKNKIIIPKRVYVFNCSDYRFP